MHVVFRESHGTDQRRPAPRLGQTPADLVVLSFSDSLIWGFRGGAGIRAEGGCRLCGWANLVAAETSVAAYLCQQTLAGPRRFGCRLIGGESYWPTLATLARYWRANRADRAGRVLPVGRPTRPNGSDSAVDAPPSTLGRCNHLSAITARAVAAHAALAQLIAGPQGFMRGPPKGPKPGTRSRIYTSPTPGVSAPAPEPSDKPAAM